MYQSFPSPKYNFSSAIFLQTSSPPQILLVLYLRIRMLQPSIITKSTPIFFSLPTLKSSESKILSQVAKGEHSQIDSNGVPFFDADAKSFRYILCYLRRKTIPDVIPLLNVQLLIQEAEYFGLKGLEKLLQSKCKPVMLQAEVTAYYIQCFSNSIPFALVNYRLQNVYCTGFKLDKCHIKNSCFEASQLIHCSFAEGLLESSEMRFTEFRNCSFANAKLRQCSMQHCLVIDSDFSNCQISDC